MEKIVQEIIPVDRYVEKRVEVPYNRVVDVPETKVVKKSRVIPKYVDKVIEVEKIQEVPVNKINYIEVEKP